MNRFNFAKNKAAIFFAMALLPTTLAYSQTTNDTVANESKIEEVVVIGYGTQRKEAVTGSVVSVGGDVVREVPSANVSQALQGRVAGVDISQSSSKPGAQTQIRIRGERSLSGGNNPLIILDGIPFAGSLTDISPSDIKSLDILKDASATSIYGSRGANGVIIITTTKGTKGQKAKLTYNTFTSVNEAFGRYPMMDGQKFGELRRSANLFTNGVDESYDNNTDWQKQLYRGGYTTNHDIGITGGTQGGGYFFGLGYFKEQALLPGQSYERYSLRGSVDQEIGIFKFGISTNSNYSVNLGNNLGLFGALSSTPLLSANPVNADGTPKVRGGVTLGGQQWLYTKNNINSLGDRWIDKDVAFSSYNNIYGEMSIPGIKGLKYRSNIGLNVRFTNNGDYRGRGVFSNSPDELSFASIANSMMTHWVFENLLTYDRNFGKHKVNVVGLYSTEQNAYHGSNISARDIPSDAFQFYNLGHAPQDKIAIDPRYQGYEKTGLQSLMGRAMYSYDNKYMISASVRSDGSSRLAPGYKWHTYPAVSVGWNVANESFLQDSKIINQLKLRAGYGETANQAIAPYSTLGSLQTRPYNFADTYATGVYVNSLPNPKLGWEFSSTYNYGVDFKMFNNRLSGTFEYYLTKTKDVLFYVPLQPTSGVDGYASNIASIENKGFEVSLNGLIFDNPDGFSWELGGNISVNNNMITSLASGFDRDEGNMFFVGHSINSIYDYQNIGLWQQGDPYLNILEPGGNVGMVKVLYTGGYNADGTPVRAIGPADRQIQDMTPDFTGGFTSRMYYKNFDLSVVGAFKSGGLLISTLYGTSGYLNQLSGRNSNVDVDYWTEENPNVRFPKPGGMMSGDNPKYGSTLGYFDASYLKIRTISIGYTFNKDQIETIGLSNLRLYATVQNPFVLFSPYHKQSGMDPETNSFANENAAVTNSLPTRFLTIGTNTPTTRNYLLGLSVTF